MSSLEDTADQLVHHLLQLGTWDLALLVISMQTQAEGVHDD